MPEKESIESFAAHHASMAIYLSTGMLEELSRRLVNGGYEPDTPAALVYKATWSDEEAYICTVQELAAVAKKHNITKTALDAGRRCNIKSALYALQTLRAGFYNRIPQGRKPKTL